LRPRNAAAVVAGNDGSMRYSALPTDLAGFAEPFALTPASRGFGLRCLGVTALAAAAVGAVLPLWPTTPFALAAAWAFARSSPRSEAWMMRHPRLGPSIQAWRRRGAVPRRAKIAAVASLPASWAGLWIAGPGAGVMAASGLVLTGVGAWILTRPD
jgi:uncharacterized membrane protein YbaN (DUF454 family)